MNSGKYIVFATRNGTMSIYKDNIYLFSKSKFMKVLRLIHEDYLIGEENLLEIKITLKEDIDYLLRIKAYNKQYNGIKIDKIIKNFESYIDYISLLLE